MSPVYVHIALALALLESLGLAALLWRVRGVRGVRLLVLFLLGVAAWITGCEAPSWFGAVAIPWSLPLLALSSLTSAVFLHFVLVLCEIPAARRIATPGYLLGGSATLAALLIEPGHYVAWHGFDHFFMPHAMGWIVGWIWSALAAAGHAVLFVCWLRRRGPPRGQLAAMFLASGWGLLCMSGYGFAHWGLELYPFPLLLLPLYPLILVYGILRYRLMIVNAWARRALAWALFVGLGSAAVVALTLLLPARSSGADGRLWVFAVSALLLAGLLPDPLRRLATRLIYPGAQLAEGMLTQWRTRLAGADSAAALAATAEREISQQLRTAIRVVLGEAPIDDTSTPTLHCHRLGDHWQTACIGWEAAPPGARHVAQLFGTVLAEAAQRLEYAVGFAARERERQKQERLAELGALAATVAHDIRNPLNIIAMAATQAPVAVRTEIAAQTARISHLASDLLDYAKSWQLERQPLDLGDHVRLIAAPYPEIEFGAGLDDGPLTVAADARRLRQVLVNLFENARAAVAASDARIAVEAARSDDVIELRICDNGTGVPAEIRPTLFQPFVSRRADGTGLGLAIVARIMQAHGGSVRLADDARWNTCFVLTFPLSPTP